MGELSVHAYPRRAIGAAYARAGVGLALCGLPLVAVPLPTIATALLGAASALFAAYGVQTATQHGATVTVSDEAIESRGWRCRRIAWRDLIGLTLAYYALRRDGEGWMQLRLADRRGGLRLDSTLDGFEAIVRHAVGVAAAGRLPLDRATIANLAALGIATDWVDQGAAR